MDSIGGEICGRLFLFRFFFEYATPSPSRNGFFFIWGLTQGWGGNGMKKHVKKGVKG